MRDRIESERLSDYVPLSTELPLPEIMADDQDVGPADDRLGLGEGAPCDGANAQNLEQLGLYARAGDRLRFSARLVSESGRP